MRKGLTGTIAACCVLSLAAFVNADQFITLSGYDTAGSGITTSTGNHTGGLFSLNVAGSSATSAAGFVQYPGNTGIASFCIDLQEYIYQSNKTYQIVPVEDAPQDAGNGNEAMGAGPADTIALLWAHYVNPNQLATLPALAATNATLASYTNAKVFQAAQMFIWNTVYPGVTYNSGTDPQGIAAILADMTSYVAGATSADRRANLVAFTSPNNQPAVDPLQDQIVEMVPEATNVISVLSILMAATVLGTSRFVRRNSKQLA